MLIQGKELRCRHLCCIADVEGVKEMAKEMDEEKMMKGKKRGKKRTGRKMAFITDRFYRW